MPDTKLLPALIVTAKGEITASNLPEFSKLVRKRLKDFNSDLRTDEDFERAGEDIATLKGAAESLKLAHQAVMDGAGDINATLTGLTELRAEITAKANAILKQVEAKRQAARDRMVNGALDGLMVDEATRSGFRPAMEAIIKGKKSFDIMREALRIEVAKINDGIERCRAMLDTFTAKHGRAAIADRARLEIMDRVALDAELARRVERIEADAREKALKAEADKARADAARIAQEARKHLAEQAEADMARNAAAKMAAVATCKPADPVPPPYDPKADAQARAAAPAAPRMINPVGPSPEMEMDEDEEWAEFKARFMDAIRIAGIARRAMKHPSNVAKGEALAVSLKQLWEEIDQ